MQPITVPISMFTRFAWQLGDVVLVEVVTQLLTLADETEYAVIMPVLAISRIDTCWQQKFQKISSDEGIVNLFLYRSETGSAWREELSTKLL